MTMSDRKKLEKEQRKQAIIETAEKLFFSEGYDNVSMNDIAKDVGLNRATLYLYFDNKEAVLFSVLLRGIRILNNLVKNNVRKASLNHKILVWGNSYASFFNLYPQYTQIYNLFQSKRFDLPDTDNFDLNSNIAVTAVVKEIIRLQKELFDSLYNAVKSLITSEKKLSNIDPFYASILIYSSMDSLLNVSPVLENEINSVNLNKYQDFKMMMFSHLIKQFFKTS